MTGLGFRVDQKIIDVLNSRKFTLSAEIIPPRNGAEQEKLFNQIQDLIKSGAQFLAITKGAGGSLRGGSLPIAQAIKDQFKVPAIAHFTCRDLTPQEVENQLMDHHYFGIRNILALRGDPPEGQKDWKPKEGAHQYAYQLIEQIHALNQGRYLVRPDMVNAPHTQAATDFCIGAAVYPEFPAVSDQVGFLKQKVDAGASYAITQMLFDTDAYAKFLEKCAKAGCTVPILPGTRVLTHQEQAIAMAKRFEVAVPKSWIERLPTKEDLQKKGEAAYQGLISELFVEFVENLKKLGAPGLHLFVLFDTKHSCPALERLAAVSYK